MLIYHNKQTEEEKSHNHFNRGRKVFDEIQHPFPIFKTVNKLGKEGNFFKLIKVINEKHTANIICNSMNTFLLRSGTRQGCPGVSSQQGKEDKVEDLQTAKEVVRLSLFTDISFLKIFDYMSK